VALIRKAKGFKRIRGFLTGETRKQRRARKVAERAARQADPAQSGGDDDDASTVYGVDVDDRSVATSPTTSSTSGSSPARKPAPPMLGANQSPDDTATAASAPTDTNYMLKVVLLLMDPDTRRFELLQLEFDSAKALVSDVLAQIPSSVTEDALRHQTYIGICGATGKEMSASQLLSTFCTGNDVLVAIPQGLPSKECARLARPILSDDKVAEMLMASGIDVKPWREEKKKKKKIVTAAPSTSRSAAEADGEKEPSSRSKSGAASLLGFALMAVCLAVLAQVGHMYVSSPIAPGHVLSPGIWLSRCGLLAFMPNCENQYLQFKNGVVTVYNDKREVAWELKGDVCNEDDESCVPGLQFKDDHTIVIGGKPVHNVIKHQHDADLSPWPFAEPPKLRVVKK
jgi:hypothetical protein